MSRKMRCAFLSVLLLASGLPHTLLAHDPSPCVDGTAAVFACHEIDLAFHFHLPDIGGVNGTEGADIWGWTDPNSGREFAIMTMTDQTAFVEVTHPTAPVYLGSLPTHTDVNLWRDVKTYGNYAFIVADFVTNHGMQIFDLTQLLNVVDPPVTFSNTAHYDGFNRAHNIVINEDTGMAYAVGTETCSGGLHMIDISTPTSPSYLGCVNQDGYTHDAQCVVYNGPDTDYQGNEICINSNEDTLTIFDLTDKEAPTQVSRTGYPGTGYTHQGWLTEDHAYFLLGDETDETSFGHPTKTYIWDMTDLDNPRLIGDYQASNNASDHNLYTKGDFVFEANYRSGLRILDISDVANGNLTEVAYFDTHPESDNAGFSGAWSSYPYFDSGTVIVSDIERGLFVLTPTGLCPEFAPPSNVAAVAAGDNQIDLSWTDNALPNETYSIFRSFGGCPAENWELVAEGVTGSTYSDNTVSGSVEYAYDVRRVNEDGCVSLASTCSSATTTGICNAPAIFAGIKDVDAPGMANCQLDVAWTEAVPNCGGGVTYSVYRSEDENFVPSAANRVASNLTGTTWSDFGALHGVNYYYVVRSTDLGSGVEDNNLVRDESTPQGVAADLPWNTGAEVGDPSLVSESGGAFVAPGPSKARLSLKHAGWHLSEARAHTGNRSFFSQYSNNLCTGVKTPPLSLTMGESPEVSFWTVYNIEEDGSGDAWDGGVVEISVDGGSWTLLNLSPAYPDVWRSSSDACGFAQGTPAFTGTSLTWTRYSADLSTWAGQNVEVRWIFSTDGAATEEGWYVDDIEVSHVQQPGTCATSLFIDSFESGDMSAWSSTQP